MFDEEGALDQLEAFASINGPAFYGLPVNSGTLSLEKRDLVVPDIYPVDDGESVHPFRGGETLGWSVISP